MSVVLLDTCAILWLASGLAPRPEVLEALERARRDDAVLVSPISAWEIAQKEKRRPGRLGLRGRPLEVFDRIAGQTGVRSVPLTAEILAASVDLDGLETNDPADRMIVASALAYGARVVTADSRILAFSHGALDYGRPSGSSG